MAWTGMRPLATSWPPDLRTATATGAAQRFSHTRTAAAVFGLERSRRLLEVVLAEEAGGGALERFEPSAVAR